MDELTARKIANCPTPEYHATHRYCPSCPWTEPQEPTIVVVDELPPRLDGAVKHWLEVNQRNDVDVKHGVFPLGFVHNLDERVESSEAVISYAHGLIEHGEWCLDKCTCHHYVGRREARRAS